LEKSWAQSSAQRPKPQALERRPRLEVQPQLKELARELGYTSDMNDSASMNIWLHKQVMTKLAANGGKVPDDLKH
jgi:hypothetical protein